MDSQKRRIAVFGATGNQGQSVARSLLQNPGYEVLCLTRNPASAKANALQDLGANVTKADGFDTEQMTEILSGCWGLFLNTNSDDPDLAATGKSDMDLGKGVLESAALAGVSHVVYSSAPSPAKLTKNAISIPSLDEKFLVEQYGREHLAFQTFIPVIVAWYLENLLDPEYANIFGGFPQNVDAEGYLTFRTPIWGGDDRVPWISVADDLGDIVHGIFLNPRRWNGRLVQGTGAISSFADLVSKFVHVTKRKCRYVPYPTVNDMPTHDISFIQQVRDLFAFTQLREGEYYCNGPTETLSAASLKRASFLAKGGQGRESLLTIDEWLQRHF